MTARICGRCGALNSDFDPHCVSCGEPLASFRRFSPGAFDPIAEGRICRFEVRELIGRGGMGAVYRARDPDLDREVAIKFLYRDTSRDEARFQREAHTAAALDHPAIATLHEIGRYQDRPFLVMPLYRGQTLEQRLARGKLELPEAADILRQLASGLAAAHAAGIVHRDLKPANVMLPDRGGVKLLDFGLAWRNGSNRLTEDGRAVGTLPYIAPGQLRGEPADASSDLWSLGVLAHEMVTGKPPFATAAAQGLAHAILHQAPTLCPELPAAWRRIVERCLEKQPTRRFQGADDVIAALAELSAPGPAARPAELSRGTRSRWSVIAALLVLPSLAFAFGRTVLNPRTPSAPTYVMVLEPEIEGDLESPEEALVRANLRVAILRALIAVDGIAPICPPRLQKEMSTAEPPAMLAARRGSASGLIRSRADCPADLCQVTLERLDGTDAQTLWAETLRQSPLLCPLLHQHGGGSTAPSLP